MSFKLISTGLIAISLSCSSIIQAADVSITWLGGPTTLIEFDGMKILTDPMLGSGEHAFEMKDPNEMFDLAQGPNSRQFKRLNPKPNISLNKVNTVLLSHAHEDHFDQQAQAELDKNISIILPISDTEKVTNLGFNQLLGLKSGDVKTYLTQSGKIRITAVTANHTDKTELVPILGQGLGYYLEFINDKDTLTLYWTGDTLNTQDLVKEVLQLGEIDILMPNMGRVGTTGPLGKISMGALDVNVMANTLKVKRVLPIHHSTYDLYLEPISVLADQAKGKKWSLDLISEGAKLSYSSATFP